MLNNKKVWILTLLFIFLCSSVQAISISGLQHSFPFDNNNVSDHTGALIGTATSTSNITGRIGDAQYFGANGYVSLSDFPSASSTENITVTYWVNYTTGYNPRYDKAFYIDGSVGRYEGHNQNTGSYNLCIEANDGSWKVACVSPLSANVWHHVAMQIEPGVAIRIFINGVSMTNASFGTLATSASSFKDIGGYSGAASTYKTEGIIDDMNFFNRILTTEEIKAIYENRCTYENMTNCESATPNITQATVAIAYPNQPYNDEDIYANVTCISNVSTIDTSLQWYRDNVAYGMEINGTIANNTATFLDILNPANTTSGEEWKFEVYCTNEADAGTRTSNTVTVKATPKETLKNKFIMFQANASLFDLTSQGYDLSPPTTGEYTSVPSGISGMNASWYVNGTIEDTYFYNAVILDTINASWDAIGYYWVGTVYDTNVHPSGEWGFQTKSNIAFSDRFYLEFNRTGNYSVRPLIFYEYANQGTSYLFSNITIQENSTHQIIALWSKTRGLELWIDGQLGASDPSKTTLMSDGTHIDYHVCGEGSATSGWNMTCDALGVINSTLTIKEIEYLWNNGNLNKSQAVFPFNGTYNPAVIVPNPKVSLTLNDTTIEYQHNEIEIGWYVNATTGIDTIIFNITYPNGSLLLSRSSANQTIILGNANITTLGNYTIKLFANTTNGTSNQTSANFLVNDTIGPIPNITAPTNTTYGSNNITVTISAVDYNTIWFNNGTLNITYTGSQWYLFPNGSNTIIAYANDTSGNIGTSNISFTIVIPSSGISTTNLTNYYYYDTNFTDYVGTNDGAVNNYAISSNTRIIDNNAKPTPLSNSYIEHGQSWCVSNKCTFMFWAYINGTSNLDKKIIYQDDSNGRIDLGFSPTNVSKLVFESRDTGAWKNVTFPAPSQNTWHHYVFKRYNNNNITVYLDGVKQGSTSFGSGTTSASTLQTIGGVSSAPSTYVFNGRIDEFSVWQRGLMEEEIQVIYQEHCTLRNFSTCGIPQNLINITVEVKDTYTGSAVNNVSINMTNGTSGWMYFENQTGSIITTNMTGNTTFNFTIGGKNYFSNYTQNKFVGSSINATIYQAEARFNATQLFSNAWVDGDFTINGVTKGTNETFYLSANTYNVIFSKAGYFNKSQMFVISALSNQSYTVENVSSAILNVTVYNLATNSYVSDFTMTAVNATIPYNQGDSTTNGWVSVPILAGYTYNVSVTGDFTTNQTILNIVAGLNSYEARVYIAQTLIINIYDEITRSRITVTNMTAILTGPEIISNITDIGYLNFSSLTPGNYTIRWLSTDNPDYPVRQTPFEILSNTYNVINLYSLNTSAVDRGAIRVIAYDQGYNTIIDVDTRLQVYYPLNDTWVEVNQCYSNSQGECTYAVDLGNQIYKVIGTKIIDGELLYGESSEKGEIFYVDGDDVELHLFSGDFNQAPNTIGLFFNTTNATLINNVSYYSGRFVDINGLNHTICLSYYQFNGASNQIVDHTCVTGASGTINVGGGVALNRSYSYTARFYLQSTNEILDEAIYPSATSISNRAGNLAKYFILGVVLIFLGMALYLGNILFFAIPTMIIVVASTFMFPGTITWYMATGVIALCISCIDMAKVESGDRNV